MGVGSSLRLRISVLIFDFSYSFGEVLLLLYKFSLELVGLLGFSWVSRPLLVEMALAFELLSERAQSLLELLILISNLTLQLRNPVLQLLLTSIIILVLFHLSGRLNQHRDAVRVPCLDGLFKQFTLLLVVPILGLIFLKLSYFILQTEVFTLLLLKFTLLLGDDLLILTVPGDLVV
jgi:hypothetical protein